jgi:hypothetical protein
MKNPNDLIKYINSSKKLDDSKNIDIKFTFDFGFLTFVLICLALIYWIFK